MTRLHYLLARNNSKHVFDQLPDLAKRVLDAQYMVDETTRYGQLRTIPVAHTCTPQGHHFAGDRVFHIVKARRPPGIPDDIHESYK